MNKLNIPIICLIIILILFIQSTSLGQDTIHKTFYTTQELIEYTPKNEITIYKYVDSTFKYQVAIPNWLRLIDNGTMTIFGGLMIDKNSEVGTVMINGFHKDQFNSWEEFHDIFITGNTFGKSTKFSEQHIWYGKATNNRPCNLGIRNRVFTLSGNKIIHHEFILI